MSQLPKYHYAILESSGGSSALFHESGKDNVFIKLGKGNGHGVLLDEVKRKEDEGWELVNIQIVRDSIFYYHFRRPR
jgi:flagellum-specific peptidoglycan hydrolase FlgJ